MSEEPLLASEGGDHKSFSSSFRRCSILGPPSLFPSQKTSDAGGPQELSTSGSRPGTTNTTNTNTRDQVSEEITLAIADLDFYYGLVKRQLMRFQSATTGLFPEISSDKEHGSVHSTIYSSLALWSLYQAFKRIDDDRGKTYELGQSAVCGLRGILKCWMVQAPRLEQFKRQQTPLFALHSKFHLETGEEIGPTEEHNHLQINVVSEYLLFLCQAISSGLHVIWTPGEVCFVQNLVYYVERAYRIPDFGIWERGSKYNVGTCEVHASSLGVAKAALEAVNGFDLFGEHGSPASVVYVDIDAHNRNRSIFETLLPRESTSKSVDAALLGVISFPAFATHDTGLYHATKAKIVKRLEGRYGFKRFIRDGYGTELEDPDERFYPDGKIQEFDKIESEWPMFYAFMVIDGVFKKNEAQVVKYQELMKKRLAYNEFGDPVLPKYFYVPSVVIENERRCPGSQHRIASNDGCSSQDLFLWGQAMMIISDLLTSQLLNVYELDPIRRHLPSYNRPKLRGRYSAFDKGGGAGTAPSDLVVQVCIISESVALQAMLNTFGIHTQTPKEIEPINICSQWELVKVYEHLGRSKELGLGGRPSRPIGTLGSSKVYRMCGQTVICYPLIFSDSEFYLSHDLALLTDDIRNELKFISQCWRLSKRPTVCLVITEDHLRDSQFPVMMELLSEFNTGIVSGVKVRLGRLQNLIASSCVEHLDFIKASTLKKLKLENFKEIFHLNNRLKFTPHVTEMLAKKVVKEDKGNFLAEFENRSSNEISEELLNINHMYGSIQLLGILLLREGRDYMVGDMTVSQRLEIANHKAGVLRHWAAVRYSSSMLQQSVDSISPYVTQILVNGKQVTVGTIGAGQSVFVKPMTPAEIHDAIYSKVQPFNNMAAVLQQELILYCGKLIATNPELFAGILKIRIGWFLLALDLYRKMKEENPDPIESCSPSEIRHILFLVLSEKNALQMACQTGSNGSVDTVVKDSNGSAEEKVDPVKDNKSGDLKLTVFQVRQINGCLTRVPERFYVNVWLSLSRSSSGFLIGKTLVPKEPTLTQMTSTELSFAHLIEDILTVFEKPEYRQLVVEFFCVLAEIFKRNPELEFPGQICVDSLIAEAIVMFKKDQNVPCDEHIVFYNSSISTTSGYMARAIVNKMLTGSILHQKMGKGSKSFSEYDCPVQ